MIEKRISKTIHDAMEQQHTSVSFEDVWEQLQPVQQEVNRGVKKVRSKKIIAILVAATMLMGMSVSAEYYRRKDDLTYTFKMDEQALGTWRSVGFVGGEKEFIASEARYSNRLTLQGLTFKENGDLVAIVNGEDGIIKTDFDWTKGRIINQVDETNSNYKVKEIDGKEYMFYEWKSGDYVYKRIEKPYLYVLERVESEEVFNEVPALISVKRDDTNIEFEENETMKGRWVSVDFVHEIEDFTPNVPRDNQGLVLTEIQLEEDGKMIIGVSGREPMASEDVYWTKDVIVNKWDQTVSKCTIKEMEGSTYMFYEWKSGDYIFGGAKPLYYVLKKQ